MFGSYRQVDPDSDHPMETWNVTTDDGQRIEVETNENGGFGPVNVWTGDQWVGVKYRRRAR